MRIQFSVTCLNKEESYFEQMWFSVCFSLSLILKLYAQLCNFFSRSSVLSSNITLNCNVRISKLGLLLLYCDHLSENIGKNLDKLEQLLDNHLHTLITMFNEPPVKNLTSVLCQNYEANSLLLDKLKQLSETHHSVSICIVFLCTFFLFLFFSLFSPHNEQNVLFFKRDLSLTLSERYFAILSLIQNHATLSVFSELCNCKYISAVKLLNNVSYLQFLKITTLMVLFSRKKNEHHTLKFS